MRPLLPPLAGGLLAGTLTAQLLGGPAGPAAAAALLLTAAAGFCVAALRGAPRHAASRLAAGAALAGLLHGAAGLPPGPPSPPPDRTLLEGRVTALRHGRRSRGAVVAAGPDGSAPRVRLTLPTHLPGARPGDRVLVDAALRPARPASNPGAPDPRSALRRRGLVAAGTARAWVRLESGAPGVERSLDRAREEVREVIGRASSTPERQAVLRALALGESHAAPPSLRAVFARAGLAHLLAVSGLHLGLVAFLLFGVLRRVLVRVPGLRLRAPETAALVCAPLTGLAVAWVAHPASATRAGTMAVVLLGAVAVGRRRDLGSALALAVVAMVGLWPATVLDLGFQLSVAAVGGLVLAGPSGTAAAGGRLRRAFGAAGRLLLATAVATAATAPLTALHFGRVPAAGSVSNLAAIPLTTVLVPVVALAAAATAAAPPGLPLLWAAADLLAGALVEVARHASDLPLASLPARVDGPGAVAVVVATLGATLAASRRTRRLCLAAMVVAVTVPLAPPGSRPPLAVTFLDVGHGDAVLLQTPTADVLVDAGGDPSGGFDVGRRVVAPALRALGVTRLTAVIVTHPHPDHFGGLEGLLDELPVAAVYHNGEASDLDGEFGTLLRGARARGVAIRLACRDPLPEILPARLECLWPHDPFPSGTYDPLLSPNDNSVVLRVRLGRHAVLLPGDLEAEGEERLLARGAEVTATVVKLPHHGSPTSSTPAFVRATGARHAVASCDARGRFDFPAPSVTRRWTEAGARLWRTDLDGAIRFVFDGAGLEVRPTLRRRDGRSAMDDGSPGPPEASRRTPRLAGADDARGGRD